MGELTQLFGPSGPANDPALREAASSLLLAFVLGQAAAWTYIYTHAGLSYSRAFVQSIVILTIVLSIGMMIIGNNIAIAFGLIGALAVIRFRNILKDTRDTSFIFFTLVIGLATGTDRHSMAILGTIAFILVVLYLHWVQFGSRDTSDAFLRFQLDPATDIGRTVQEILGKHCRRTALVSQRFPEEGEGEVAYRLVLRNPRRAADLLRQIKGTHGISNVSFVLQEEQSEV